MLETLDYTIHIGSTPTFLYFDLYLYSAYAAHQPFYISICISTLPTEHITIRLCIDTYTQAKKNNKLGEGIIIKSKLKW